eukprot:11557374-Ditylum_brightwellii.AAC.1
MERRKNTSHCETIWLTWHPYPTQVVLDRGTEFMAEFTEMISRDYGVKKTYYSKEYSSKKYH